MTIKAINVRNQFKGTIKEIVHGDVLSEIDVQTASGVVTSVITTRSVKELELAKNTLDGPDPPGFFAFYLAVM
ncbi:TOBE domain-containing protein [Pseudomonas syringae]|uniref:TOBE domain-containing protein n=1 Tax=Pseudomonas syringae TaxID=317 RepID=UPI00200A6889|nr:TOBE domain-containing protein [Pseudomonas syringae]MCK9739554.1 TOBE domain-containing protein [Pseudomonas syringae pv. syringae]